MVVADADRARGSFVRVAVRLHKGLRAQMPIVLAPSSIFPVETTVPWKSEAASAYVPLATTPRSKHARGALKPAPAPAAADAPAAVSSQTLQKLSTRVAALEPTSAPKSAVRFDATAEAAPMPPSVPGVPQVTKISSSGRHVRALPKETMAPASAPPAEEDWVLVEPVVAEEPPMVEPEVAAMVAGAVATAVKAVKVAPVKKKPQDGLDKGALKHSLKELKSFAKPPQTVIDVMAAARCLLAPAGTDLKKLDPSWKATQKALGSDGFLKQLVQGCDKGSVPAANIEKARKFTASPDFNPDAVKCKSAAAAAICGWVVKTCA